jgi:hypothetical protein
MNLLARKMHIPKHKEGQREHIPKRKEGQREHIRFLRFGICSNNTITRAQAPAKHSASSHTYTHGRNDIIIAFNTRSYAVCLLSVYAPLLKTHTHAQTVTLRQHHTGDQVEQCRGDAAQD